MALARLWVNGEELRLCAAGIQSEAGPGKPATIRFWQMKSTPCIIEFARNKYTGGAQCINSILIGRWFVQ